MSPPPERRTSSAALDREITRRIEAGEPTSKIMQELFTSYLRVQDVRTRNAIARYKERQNKIDTS